MHVPTSNQQGSHWQHSLYIRSVAEVPRAGCNISYFSHCYTKMPDQRNFREEGFIWAQTQRPVLRRRESTAAGAWGGWSHGSHSPEAEREPSLCWCSARFLLFIQSETPAHQMALPTLRVGLPSFFSQQSKSSLTDTPGGGLDASRSCQVGSCY